MKIFELFEADNRKRNKLLYFRQTIDSIQQKIRGKVLIVFDTETTGFSANLPWVQVTEIAALAFDADTGEQLGKYHKKVNLTASTRDEINTQKRNMSADDSGAIEGPRAMNIPSLFKMSRYGDRDAPRADIVEVYKGFADFVNRFDRPILIAQNAGFDMGHMFAPMKKMGIEKPKFQEVLDTMVLGRVWIYPLLKAAAAVDYEPAFDMLKSFEEERNGKRKVSFSLKNLGKAFGVQAKHWHSGLSDVVQTYGIFKGMIEFMNVAKEHGFDQHPDFSKYHARMSGQAFYYGKRPAFGATLDTEVKKGIAARGKPRI